MKKLQNKKMKLAIYINRNHPILNYGQTGMFDSRNSRFYPDGGATYKNPKGKTMNALYFIADRSHIWFDEDGYYNL